MSRRFGIAVGAIVLVTTACGEDDKAATGGDPPSTPTPTASPTEPSGPPTAAPGVVTPHSEDPVLRAAAGERWTNPGWTVADGDTLWMFRNSFSSFPGVSRTDLMRSRDGGETWTEVGPVITTEDVPFTERTAFVMTGWVDEAGWHAVIATYEGQTEPSVFGVATADRPDGEWTVAPEPIVEPGITGGFDDLRIREPSVAIADDGTLHLYYTGWAEPGADSEIGLATSTDGGLTWEGRGSVLTGDQDWTRGDVGGAQVVRAEPGWVMLYDSTARGASAAGLATSSDGFSWTPWDQNPVIDRRVSPGGSIFQSEVVQPDGDVATYLIEAGQGSGRTSIYLLDLDLSVVANRD